MRSFRLIFVLVAVLAASLSARAVAKPTVADAADVAHLHVHLVVPA